MKKKRKIKKKEEGMMEVSKEVGKDGNRERQKEGKYKT